jgi:hypothetical protein
VALAALVAATGSAEAVSRPQVILDHGHLLGKPWSTRAFRGKQGRLCLQVNRSNSLFYVCNVQPTRTFVPVIVDTEGGGANKSTVVLVVTMRRVHRVHLDLAHRHDLDLWPKRITRKKARETGLRRNFRYKTLTFKGGVCLLRHTDFTRHGRVLNRSYKIPCRAQDRQGSHLRTWLPAISIHRSATLTPTPCAASLRCW